MGEAGQRCAAHARRLIERRRVDLPSSQRQRDLAGMHQSDQRDRHPFRLQVETMVVFHRPLRLGHDDLSPVEHLALTTAAQGIAEGTGVARLLHRQPVAIKQVQRLEHRRPLVRLE